MPAMPFRFRHLRLLSLLAMLFVLPSFAEAAAKVNGRLSTIAGAVGEDLIYELEIQDGAPDRLPDFPKVEGLEVNGAGRNSSTIFSNGSLSQSVTYRYRLTLRREGEITIPAINVIVDGTPLATQPIKIRVT